MKLYFVSKTRGINLDAIAFVHANGPQLLIQLQGVAENVILLGEEAVDFADYLRSQGEGAVFAEGHSFEKPLRGSPTRVLRK
jgi:hypothetical protein